MGSQSQVLALVWLAVLVLVQVYQVGCESTESVPATQITQTDHEYIGKYLPEMWMALKRANADEVYLLRMKKLEAPARSLHDTMKSCILKYLQAIKPVAYVKLDVASNDSCSVRVVKGHVDILRTASRKGFRCLHSFKIGISNVYADAPQIPVDDQKALDKWFGECLTELEAKATGDFEQLSEKVVECTKEMAGIGMSTISTSDETEATEATSTDSDDGDWKNQVQIPGQQNSSSQTS